MEQSSFRPFVVAAKDFHVQRAEGVRVDAESAARETAFRPDSGEQKIHDARRTRTHEYNQLRLERSMQHSADER